MEALYQGLVTEAEDKVWLVLPGSWLGPGSGQAGGVGDGRASRHSPHFPLRNWHKTQPELCRGRGLCGASKRRQETPAEPERARKGPQGDAQQEGFPASSTIAISIIWKRKLRPRTRNRFSPIAVSLRLGVQLQALSFQTSALPLSTGWGQ